MVAEIVGAETTTKTNLNLQEIKKNFNVHKSENDSRLYRLIELQNGIKILLISDETADKSAASVDVHIGHLVDPDEVPGIAHFCEHMLFLGTHKYPVENEFSQYISQNGGTQNAYTGGENTNYHFDVKCSAFDGALDRFSQFFISPCFDQGSTDRELKAIDSEHQKNILVDGRRLNYIDRVTSKENHVFRKFGTGNLQTLQTIPNEKDIDIRKLLLDFHQKYYSSNIMSVCVLGKESLDELEAMVIPKFKDIANKNVEVPIYTDHPYGKEQLQVMINVKSVRKMKQLRLIFPTPEYGIYYKEKPDHYVSHLIGHEGEGSLFSYLKNKSWAHSLSAGGKNGAKGFEFFLIDIALSDDGIKHINEIIAACFEYIAMLKSNEPSEEIYKEQQMIDEIRFRFKDKASPRPYVTNCSKKLHRYEPSDVLIGPYLMKTFSPELIKDVLQQLRPNNFRCFLQTQEGDDNLVYQSVEYYGAEYNITPIDTKLIEEWTNIAVTDKFHLPKKNSFIPESFDVKVNKSESAVKGVPKMIKDSEMMRIWYKADDTFYLPKSCINFHLSSPMSNLTPSHAAHLRLFIMLIDLDLNEYLYDAELAGISGLFSSTDMGILLMLSGYNDKQPLYLECLLKKMINLPLKQDNFDLQMEILEQELKNFDSRQPYQQIRSIFDQIMEENSWNAEEVLDSLSDINISTLKSFISSFFRNVYVECLMTGNMLQEEALKIAVEIHQLVIDETRARPMLPVQHMMYREYNLPEGCSYIFEKRNNIHDMSCVMVYLQVGLQETRNNVLCELFSTAIDEPFFDVIRTKEQLGYLVSSGLGRSYSVQGLKFMIQSDKPPGFVEERVDDFLKSYENELMEMPNDKFNDFVDALTVRKLDKPKLLKQESTRYWNEISTKQYHFRRQEHEVEELKKLTKQDLIDFYRTYVSPLSRQRKKMACVLLGKNAESILKNSNEQLTTWNVIDDVMAFKTRLPLYPLIMPFNNVPIIASTKSRL